MDKIADEGKLLLINRLRPLLAIWFFAGMPLNMLLSWLYFFLGGPLPGILFLLSSLVYLSGGLLGTLWSLESLRKQASIRWEIVGALLVLLVSVGFLYLGVLFALKGLQRL
jgi:hypothetical protein